MYQVSKWKHQPPPYYHPGRSGTIRQGNRVLAYFGEIHPRLKKSFDTDQSLVGFEVFLDLLPMPKMKKSALALSPYQSVNRDFAFLMNRDVPVDLLIKTIQKVDKSLITHVDVFDVYQGDKVDASQKSVAVEIRLNPSKGTLTDQEIQELSHKIISHVEKTTGAHLRQA